MSIIMKTKPSLSRDEWDTLRHLGALHTQLLSQIPDILKAETIKPKTIEGFLRDSIPSGVRLGNYLYKGFPGYCCVSPNDVAYHGVPANVPDLISGDIVTVDFSLVMDGVWTDACRTYSVGLVDTWASQLVLYSARVTDAGVKHALACAEQGIPVSSEHIAAAIRQRAKELGVAIVKDIGGHCIGHNMHENPHFAYVTKYPQMPYIITPGTSFCIEPVVLENHLVDVPKGALKRDGWTVVFKNRLSAQFETQLLLTEEGIEIIAQ